MSELIWHWWIGKSEKITFSFHQFHLQNEYFIFFNDDHAFCFGNLYCTNIGCQREWLLNRNLNYFFSFDAHLFLLFVILLNQCQETSIFLIGYPENFIPIGKKYNEFSSPLGKTLKCGFCIAIPTEILKARDFPLSFYPHWLKNSHKVTETGVWAYWTDLSIFRDFWTSSALQNNQVHPCHQTSKIILNWR